MIYIVLVGLFALFYLIIFTSLIKSEGISFFGLLLDVVLVVILIIFYFIGKNLDGYKLQTYFECTTVGSYVYMYFAIKMFWIKPALLEYYILKESGDTEDIKEEIEEKELHIQTARIRAIYYFLVAVALFIITKILMVNGIDDNLLSLHMFLILGGILTFLVKLIIDIINKIRYGIFLFKSLIPLIVTIWIFIATKILL